MFSSVPFLDRINDRSARFLDWWLSELAALLPESLRTVLLRRFSVPRMQVRGDGKFEIDAAARSASRVDVLIAESALFVRQVTLPKAARSRIRQVLALQIEQHVPWKSDEIFFTPLRITSTDVGGKISIDVAFLPRTKLDEISGHLEEKGLTIRRVLVEMDCETGTQLKGLPGAVPKTIDRATVINLAAAALVVLLGVAAVISINGRRARELEEIARLTATARSDAVLTSEYEARLEALDERRAFLLEAQSRREPLEVLNALSRALPDTAWLRELRVSGESIHLQGSASNASSILALLDDQPFLENVEFASPVTRDPNGAERFDLTARYVSSTFDE